MAVAAETRAAVEKDRFGGVCSLVIFSRVARRFVGPNSDSLGVLQLQRIIKDSGVFHKAGVAVAGGGVIATAHVRAGVRRFLQV